MIANGGNDMIEKIQIKNVASYDSSGIELNLKKINYIFGSNGTGKTTISEFLRNSNDQKFSSCKIHWKTNRSKPDIFVYNRHFVQENFNVKNEIKGIFTLGKESSDILAKIEDKMKAIEKHKEKIDNLDNHIKEKEVYLDNLKQDFMNKCWSLKQKYDKHFMEAFIGLRNNRENFMMRCIEEAESNQNNLYTYDELLRRVNSVFKGTQEKINIIPKIHYDVTVEENPIFQTKIIGKKDLDIAKLITNLNISDWVKQGHQHMNYTNGICPFCQQKLPINFKEKLDEYFDETYTEQINTLNLSIERYVSEINTIIEKYRFLKDENIPFVNKENIKNLLEIIISIYNENIQMLETKKSEPSRSIKLKSISNYIEQINQQIDQANVQISEHNRIIDNLKEEKNKLIKDIWRFIVHENDYNYQIYKKELEIGTKAIEGMKKSRLQQMHFKETLEQEVIKLQNELTSVLPSINQINNLLKSFGFTNFILAESDEKGNYKIVRANGEDANETLSEGEKTFISFLYFYQLLNGSNDKAMINSDRIIVIDDPISSLDSNILFIVSNLINGLKQRIRNNSNFKQLIILTHNVYFHKEISFNKGNKKLDDEAFWILRKTNDISHIQEYDENPIKNSYELLWKELKENQNSITSPNIMRRILENYFKFFGNIDVYKIIDGFPEDEKIVCYSLLSWANDGSHHIYDDLFVDSSQELIQKYFTVFRKIFVISNHQSHFEMMMGNIQEDVEDDSMAVELDQVAATQE